MRELDAKARTISELTLALQREERARAGAGGEAAQLRSHLTALERELRTAQVCVCVCFLGGVAGALGGSESQDAVGRERSCSSWDCHLM